MSYDPTLYSSDHRSWPNHKKWHWAQVVLVSWMKLSVHHKMCESTAVVQVCTLHQITDQPWNLTWKHENEWYMNGFPQKKSPLPGRSPFSGESCFVLEVFFVLLIATHLQQIKRCQVCGGLIWFSHPTGSIGLVHLPTLTIENIPSPMDPIGRDTARYVSIFFKPWHLLSPAEIGSHQILPCVCPRQAAKNAQVLCSQDVLPVSWLHMFCVFQKISCWPVFSITRYQRPNNLSVVVLKKQMFTGFIPLPWSSFSLNQVRESSTGLNFLNSSLTLSSSISPVFVFVGDFLRILPWDSSPLNSPPVGEYVGCFFQAPNGQQI